MKTSSPITKKQSKKKSSKNGEYNNPQNKRIYINSNNAEIYIGYDISKQTRYIQISHLD